MKCILHYLKGVVTHGPCINMIAWLGSSSIFLIQIGSTTMMIDDDLSVNLIFFSIPILFLELEEVAYNCLIKY